MKKVYFRVERENFLKLEILGGGDKEEEEQDS